MTAYLSPAEMNALRAKLKAKKEARLEKGIALGLEKPRRKVPTAKLISRKKKELDCLWSLAVRTRDKKCLMCEKVANLQAHHWLLRRARSLATRWDPDNGATLCYYCHLCEIHLYSDKEFMDRFYATMDARVSPEKQAAMKEAARIGADYGLHDLEGIEAGLKLFMASCLRGDLQKPKHHLDCPAYYRDGMPCDCARLDARDEKESRA